MVILLASLGMSMISIFFRSDANLLTKLFVWIKIIYVNNIMELLNNKHDYIGMGLNFLHESKVTVLVI